MQDGFDVAVARLHEPVKSPKCAKLPGANAVLEHNNRLYGAGWGMISPLGLGPDVLQIITGLTVVRELNCPGVGKILEHMLCLDPALVQPGKGE